MLQPGQSNQGHQRRAELWVLVGVGGGGWGRCLPECKRLRDREDEGPWLLVLTQQMTSLSLKQGQWRVLGMERKWLGERN